MMRRRTECADVAGLALLSRLRKRRCCSFEEPHGCEAGRTHRCIEGWPLYGRQQHPFVPRRRPHQVAPVKPELTIHHLPDILSRHHHPPCSPWLPLSTLEHQEATRSEWF